MILHGNLMAAARALMLAPRPASTAGLLLHCPTPAAPPAATPAATPGGRRITLIAGDPLGEGAVQDLARPEAVLHRHAGTTRDLRLAFAPVLFHGAFNAGAAWQGTADLSAPGRHHLAVCTVPRRDRSARLQVQQIALAILGHDAARPLAPLGLAAEIVPDRDPDTILPGMLFSGRVLAAGRPVAGITVCLERMTRELGATGDHLVAATDGTGSRGAPGWAFAETDAQGRFRTTLPAAGLWALCAPGAGAARRRGWQRLRQDAILWMRVGAPVPAPRCDHRRAPAQAD
ncbi:DUF4198 domain-containing protein [Phaeovulum vinaykumarii]|uniref:Uncharacterized conserved protein, contains GH25 family domain n=1 Tax=Phaeovulum vinaykumarii TaxID=407234 RepID=A0A1N7MIG9_9RHOB|nr:DUF4198 domain-containing protein [Phaeovulum vinaykumarii]SIS85867.1 Uncharacterized conserved protein, contains GH25 family domain [Phaeovulum vinaykumarii]SOC12403.1 uncharacterized GH25 family protein [Phaeovulum vinaykumarii]